MCSRNSLYTIMKAHPEYSTFLDLMQNGGSVNRLLTSISSSYTSAGEYNVNIFDAYNYTVYIPTNESLQELHEKGFLPDWNDYENLSAEQFGGDASLLKKARTIIADRILNFLKYHIQDNSVLIGGEPVNKYKYETATLNPLNKRFYSVQVTSNDDQLTITDQIGNQRKVIKKDGLYNIIGREYWVQSAANVNVMQLYNASDLVVHQIDGPLFFDKAQHTSWQDEIEALKQTQSEE